MDILSTKYDIQKYVRSLDFIVPIDFLKKIFSEMSTNEKRLAYRGVNVIQIKQKLKIMMTKQLNWMMTLTLFVSLLIASCQKEDVFSDASTTENYSEIDLRDSEETNGSLCYEYTYPIVFEIEDGETVTINSREELQDFAEEWRTNNPGVRKPKVQLPVEVTLANGEVVQVETAGQLRRLRHACKRKRARGFVLNRCFDLIYPVTISFQDGGEVTYDNQEDLLEAMKIWRDENEEGTEIPTIVFPQDVELKDGTVITVESKEQFRSLAGQCIENRPHGPCYELIFPITLDLPDGISMDIADRESLREALQAWKEANPDAADRPEISFPHDVTLPNGEVVTLENAEDAHKLLAACHLKSHFPAIFNNECFTVNFPVSFQTMNGDTTEVNSIEDFEALIEEGNGRRKHHHRRNYPKLILPIEVTLLADESIVTIEDYEDLMAVLATCREE